MRTADEQRKLHDDAMRRVVVVNDVLRAMSSDYETMGDVASAAFANELRK